MHLSGQSTPTHWLFFALWQCNPKALCHGCPMHIAHTFRLMHVNTLHSLDALLFTVRKASVDHDPHDRSVFEPAKKKNVANVNCED